MPKKVTAAQLSKARESGAKIKREAPTVQMPGLEELVSSLRAMQSEQAKIAELVGQAMAMMLNGPKGSEKEIGELASAMKELAASLDRKATRPNYHFVADRTETGFEIVAKAQAQSVKH